MVDVRRLPGPFVDSWEWQLRGACRGSESEVFFHPEGERGPRRAARDAAAKAICANCPVILECRAHSLASREPYGVWGGLTEDERFALLAAPAEPRPPDVPEIAALGVIAGLPEVAESA